MSRATSIAGVRPQGWLARVCAPTAQFLGVRVPSAVVWRMARALRRWAWEGDDLARQRSGTRPRVVQTDTFCTRRRAPDAGEGSLCAYDRPGACSYYRYCTSERILKGKCMGKK
jgi:hypothetical protein